MTTAPTRFLPALGALLLLGPLASAQCVEGCTAIHTYTGEAPSDQFGWVSNSLGDINGDGIEDFVITAPQNDGGGIDAGRIYVYSGGDGAEIFRRSGTVGTWFGHDANEAGDIDGGGRPDLIVGAPFNGRGRAVVYSSEGNGSVIRNLFGASPGDEFGYRVHGGGDFDGDGTPDLVIGARRHDTGGADAGRAYVYSGGDFSIICTMDGLAAGHLFGSGVTFVGDVNGDGRDDVAIGAMNAGGGGRTYVFGWNGAACELIHTLTPPLPATNFGQWFMNGGFDVDGDDVPDIYVNDFPRHRAHVFSGATGNLIYSLSGDGNGQFGIGRMIEDMNGDGRADFILAAWISSQGAPNAGKAFVYSGIDGSVLDTYTHDIAGAGFGFDANGMGDIDGDGAVDYLITAASDLGGRGRAYVIAGEVFAPVVGDLDGDGLVTFADLLAVLAAWGECPVPPAACPADFDRSGTVGFEDLLTVLGNWS